MLIKLLHVLLAIHPYFCLYKLYTYNFSLFLGQLCTSICKCNGGWMDIYLRVKWKVLGE